jgi:hypothetical protein
MSSVNSPFVAYSRAQAPVIAAINGAFTGLVSIRAFDAQAAFIQQSEERIDRYTRVSMVFYHVNRWIAVRIQVMWSHRVQVC